MAVTQTAFKSLKPAGPGVYPIGAVVPVLPDIHGSAFQLPALGTVVDGWMRCQGTLAQRTIPSGALAGAIIPDLTDSRFLQASTVSWSNANDTNPTYKSQPATFPNTVSLSYTGTAVPNVSFFSPGTYTPAGTISPVTLTDPFVHSHVAPHSHPNGTYGAMFSELDNSTTWWVGYAPTSSGGFTAANVQPSWPNTPSAVGLGKKANSLGSTGTSTYLAGTTPLSPDQSSPGVSPGGTDFSAAHTHPWFGTSVARNSFASPGTFTPTGTISGFTDRRPKYLSCIFLIRVS